MESKFSTFNMGTPQKIVGLYLTELDYIMVKIELSNGTHMNVSVGNLSDLLPSDLNCLTRDISQWSFKKDRIK